MYLRFCNHSYVKCNPLVIYLFTYFKITRGIYPLVTPESNKDIARRRKEYDMTRYLIS